jgi:cyanophycin synthetase
VYFSATARNPVAAAHTRAGGAGVLVEDGWIVLVDAGQRAPLVALEQVGFTAGGRIPFQVQNALAAVAAAWAGGLDPALIARALSAFATDTATVPGRFNLAVLNGVEVIIDYGHNLGGMRALAEAVASLGPRRTVMTLGLPGDRRDEDLIATVRTIAPVADALVLYDLRHRRGRAPGEVPALLARHVPETESVTTAADQASGITAAWRQARPGDRLVVIADEVDEGIELVHALAADAAASGERPLVLDPDALPEG